MKMERDLELLRDEKSHPEIEMQERFLRKDTYHPGKGYHDLYNHDREN